MFTRSLPFLFLGGEANDEILIFLCRLCFVGLFSVLYMYLSSYLGVSNHGMYEQ